MTDAMAAAGMPDGDYRLGPQSVRVRDGVARLAEGGSIADGTTHLLDQVRRHAGLGLLDVVAAASSTPARAVGLIGVGALVPGGRADLVVTDAALRPLRVMSRAIGWERGLALELDAHTLATRSVEARLASVRTGQTRLWG